MYVNNHSYFCGCIIMSSNSAIIIILNCQELCKHTVDYEKKTKLLLIQHTRDITTSRVDHCISKAKPPPPTKNLEAPAAG